MSRASTSLRWLLPAGGAIFFLSGCGTGSDSAVEDCKGLQGATTCGPTAPALALRPLPAQQDASTLRIYVDRSGSMAGYLDPGFGAGYGATDEGSLRQVIDRVLAAGSPGNRRVYGFGTKVVTVPTQTNQDVIRTLVEQRFYSDNNTRLEDVLDSVAADGQRREVHLVVTDGRRGSGGDAIAQYRRLGELAREWAEDPSSLFAIAALKAPFHPVSRDKAGCWTSAPTTEFRCPLYLVLFAPRSMADGVLARMRETGARLLVAPTLSDDRVTVEVRPRLSYPNLRIAGGGTPHPRLSFQAPVKPDSALVDLTVRLRQSVGRFALDDSVIIRLSQAAVSKAPAKKVWSSVDATTAWVKPRAPRADAAATSITVPIVVRSRPQFSPLRYLVEVSSAGRPGWLAGFEAAQHGDSVRTYGLSALFAQLSPVVTPLAGASITIF